MPEGPEVRQIGIANNSRSEYKLLEDSLCI